MALIASKIPITETTANRSRDRVFKVLAMVES